MSRATSHTSPHPQSTTGEPSGAAGSAAAEIKAAAEAVAALATAAKSFTLYPPGHAMARKQIDTLVQAFGAFFDRVQTLTLEIGRDGLSYRDTAVYTPLPTDDPLLPPLLRDGFLWIAFHKGIDGDQLALFLEAVNRHRVLVDEPEGDLVTELWQADLKQIRYEAIEEFWDTQPRFDFSQFSVCPPEESVSESPPSEAQGEHQDGHSDSAADEGPTAPRASQRSCASVRVEGATNRRELMRLSAKEKDLLHARVEALETQDNTATVREILLYTLGSQRDQSDFNRFLSVIHDLLFDHLHHQQASHFHDLLRGVRLLQKNTGHGWQKKAIGKFIQTLSRKEVWEAHSRFFQELHQLSESERRRTADFIQLLAPSFVAVLVPELIHIRGTALHQHLIRAAATLAARNIQALEACLPGADETALRQMVMILGEMSGERPHALLARMGRHPAGAVRESAIRTLMAKTTPTLATVAGYLDDSHAGVRSAALDYLARTQDPKAEALLRDHITKDDDVDRDDDHLIACYTALARCGGQASIPFFEGVLFDRRSGSLLQFGSSAHQLGAALALRQCAHKGAQQILEKAAKSLFPSIRNAAKRAKTA